MLKTIAVIFIVTTLFSCNNGVGEKGLNSSPEAKKEEAIDFSKLPYLNENGNLTAVIEIPAGTNHKYEYNYEKKDFECEIRDGKPRVVKFLPYVGNYGFIPGTYMDPAIGGDGDALDVLVLSESVVQGSILEIKPIGTLRLLDGGEEDHKVIAVPVNEETNLLSATSYIDLNEATKTIIKSWFTNYKGAGKMEFQGWIGTDSTLKEISKWKKK